VSRMAEKKNVVAMWNDTEKVQLNKKNIFLASSMVARRQVLRWMMCVKSVCGH
jgi:hypothetical protein